MEVTKIFNIINSDKEIIGTINKEKINNDLTVFTINTESIGVSFNSLEAAIAELTKYNYTTQIKESDVTGFNLKDIKIFGLVELGDVLESFQNIYEGLLNYAVEKAFLQNHNYELINITGVLDKALELLEDQKACQWIANQKVKSEKLTENESFECQDSMYLCNEKIINSKFKSVYKIIDNSITGLTVALV